MGWLIFFLTMLTTLANLADFLFGKESDATIRRHVYRTYLRLEDGDWAAAYQAPAEAVIGFMTRPLFRGRSTPAMIIRAALCSIAMTALMSLLGEIELFRKDGFRDLFDDGARSSFWFFWFQTMVNSTPGNLIGDLLAWTATLQLLRHVRQARPASAFGLLVVSLVASTFCLWLTLEIRDETYVATGLAMVDTVLRLGLLDSVDTVNVEFLSYTAYVIPAVQVTLPLLVFFTCSAVGLAAFLGRRAIERPLAFLLERLDASPKHVLTLLAIAFSAAATLVGAWGKT